MIRICEHCRESYTYAHTCPVVVAGIRLVALDSMPPDTWALVNTPRDCVHGQLARVCLTCEHERTIAELKAYLRKAVGRLRDVDRACGGQTKLLEGLEHE